MFNKIGGIEMLEGKVIKDFNDKQNNLKKYTVGKKFKAEDKRYKELGKKINLFCWKFKKKEVW